MIVTGTFLMAMFVNLAQAQFKPTVFQPQTYQPQTIDYSILERSFQQQENRSNLAYQKYTELAQLIGEKRQQISNDRETLEWFSNNIDTELKTVKCSLEVADYQGTYVPIYNSEGIVIGAYDWKEIGGPNNTRVILP